MDVQCEGGSGEGSQEMKERKRTKEKEHFRVPEYPENQCGDGEKSDMMSPWSYFQL